MKITKSQLKQIIKEELTYVLEDQRGYRTIGVAPHEEDEDDDEEAELAKVFEVGGPWGPERYDPGDPSNTPEAIAKDEATTAMVSGLKLHLSNRGDLTPEAIAHIVLDVEEAIVTGLEGVHIPAPEVSTDVRGKIDAEDLGV